ncbi:MAG: hypothetical protein CVU78_01830 [Elusimicrobia bacterium HGW-Elusimicrobia-2]|nr:MAG: hypothetical protein CVU78_01830 [Elusimicrobia bacterium HGW-Elusimicrobia-2]
MAQLGKITFTGKSGNKYDFIAYSWDTNFKEGYGAVYFITKRTQKATGGYNHVEIYVGETEDLSTRFDNHHKEDCFKKYNANCKCIHGEQNKETRLAIEKDLIDNYNLPCND